MNHDEIAFIRRVNKYAGITLYESTIHLFSMVFSLRLPILLMLMFIPPVSRAQVMQTEAPSGVESQLIEATKQQLTGNPDKAIEMFEKLRSEPEARATVYYQLSRLYLSKSRLEDALNAIDESVKADPVNKWTRIFQANLFESVGRYRNTAEAYEGLCFIEPENYTMYDLAALNYVKADMEEKALAVLDRAQSKFGPTPVLAIKKSRILYHLGKGKKAVEILNASIREYPRHQELYEESYQLLNSLSDSEGAQKMLDRLKVINPSYRPPGEAEAKVSEGSGLEKIRLQIIGGNATADEIIRALVPFAASYRDSDTASLSSVANLLIEKYPGEAKAWALRGDLHYFAEDYREAVQAYNKATSLQNVPFSVWENTMHCLMRMNLWKTLTEKVNEALDYFPNQAFLYYAYGVAQLQLSMLTEAMVQARQFSLMSANNPSRMQQASLLLARISSAQEKYDDAEKFWNECLKSEGDEATALEYAVYRSSRGLSVDMKSVEAAEARKELHRPYVLNRLATIAYYRKDWAAARARMDECLSLKGGRVADNYELAAQICIGQGQKEQARDFLKKGMEVSDDKNRLESLLKRIN